MNSIAIEKIEFENFRQYGTGSISFPKQQHNSLSVFVAQNGTGKTTLLNAITWCLYKEEKHLPGGKALPIFNVAELKNGKIGDIQDVAVTLIVSTDDKIIEFKRIESFEISKNAEGKKDGIPAGEKFTVAVTPIGKAANTKNEEGPEAEAIVKQYFDKNICEFYFFDGEKLGDFFAAGRSDEIKRSIFNISQVNLLSNAIDHLNAIKNKLNRIIGKARPNIGSLLDERDKLSKSFDEASDKHKAASDERKKLDGIIAEYDKTLQSLKPVSELQNKRSNMEKKREDLLKDKEDIEREKSAFIRQYLTLINLYPSVKKVYDIIVEKQESGELPPSIDIAQVKKILETNIERCPMCDNLITEHSKKFLEEFLEKNNVSSRTANYLSGIRDSLESLIEETKEFPVKRKSITDRSEVIDSSIRRIEKDLEDISQQFKAFNYKEEEIKEKVRDTEEKRRIAQEALKVCCQEIGVEKGKKELFDKQITKLNKDIEKEKKKLDTHDENEEQVKVLEMLIKRMTDVKDNIMSGMRAEIEKITGKIFDSMIWKKYTFGNIKIDEDYSITVFNKDNTQMTGSLSATEQMALAYAYTLAIHEASGRNCPLVIDSPLGRVSDDNRENMAKVLLEVSKNKQIIMLFTPDEYSAPVRKMYEGIASVRNLKLSKDETYVEGIEHNG